MVSTPNTWRSRHRGLALAEGEFEFSKNYPDAKEGYSTYFHGPELHALLTLLCTDETEQMEECFCPLGFLYLFPIQIPAGATEEWS